jgi:hypothetical protein
MSKGTKELSEAVRFICSLASVAVDAAADGRITIGDASRLIPLLATVPTALDGLDEAIEEAKDLSSEELAEVTEAAKEAFDLENDVTEELVEDAVDVVLKLYSIIQKIRG